MLIKRPAKIQLDRCGPFNHSQTLRLLSKGHQNLEPLCWRGEEKMIFTVELKAGFDTAFRLQTNGEWRRMNRDYSLREEDFRTTNASDVLRLTPYGTEILLDGIQYQVSPAIGRLGEILSGDSLVFRNQFPEALPTQEQLEEVISNGDDSQHNCLILNVRGEFELRQRPPFDIHR